MTDKRHTFTAYLALLRQTEWVVYSKRPFGGPQAVLAYLSLYMHCVAISNSRLIGITDTSVSFKWKDYRASGRGRPKVMTLAVNEFIRRSALRRRRIQPITSAPSPMTALPIAKRAAT